MIRGSGRTFIASANFALFASVLNSAAVRPTTLILVATSTVWTLPSTVGGMAEEVKRGVEMVSGSVRYVHPPLQHVCTDGVWHRTFELAVAVLVVPFSQYVTLEL